MTLLEKKYDGEVKKIMQKDQEKKKLNNFK